MDNCDKRQVLAERIARFNFDPTDENQQAVMEIVREVDPAGYLNLVKCQCAYEFHMILEAILNP